MLVIFFSAQHLSFHVCLHQLADETAAPGPTCAQDAARCTAWIAVCSDSEANKSSNSRKLKSAAILYLVPSCSTLFLLVPSCSTLFLLVPSCSLHLGFRTTLRPRSGMMQPSSQTLEPKMPVLSMDRMDGSEMMRSEVKLMTS